MASASTQLTREGLARAPVEANWRRQMHSGNRLKFLRSSG